MAERIFRSAIVEGRSGELLSALFNGGSVTIDHNTGLLAIISGEQLAQMVPERAGREGDSQPLPDPDAAVGDDVQSRVIRDIELRREVGIRRYGQALHIFNGRNALLDAYEEVLDLAMYLKQRLVEEATNERENHG